jgi:hypothetical protein
MALENLTTFGVGCVGAIAPEVIRLYNLRLKPVFSWSWGYLLFSIPFVLLGGFMAWLLEPTNNYAAFYAGVSTPVLISSIAKNTGVAAPEAPSEPTLPQPPVSPYFPPSPPRPQGKGGFDTSTRISPPSRQVPMQPPVQVPMEAPMQEPMPYPNASPYPTRSTTGFPAGRKPSLFKQFLGAL